MLFSSISFLFLFLPIIFAVYYFAPQKIRNAVLLIASLVFYAWGEMAHLYIMLAVIIMNWSAALAIDDGCGRNARYFWDKLLFLFSPEYTEDARKKRILTIAVIANIAVLFYFKYMNFFMTNLGGNFAKIALPLGISFYIFQALSYVIDVYRGGIAAQRSLPKLALYISLFPQLVAGPIVKYHEMNKQLDKRSITRDDILYGVRRFIIGLGKKVLIANMMGEIADKVFNAPVDSFGTGIAWIGLIAYAFQIFYDFAGYSDMAIGLGRCFGFHFLENFNYPYISKSITEFWRRWHISLSTWFKEYLYIPLGGNRTGHTYRNLMIVFLATGIWHGAEWTFILWGVWHGIFILMEKKIGLHKFVGRWANLYAMAVVLFGWLLFRAPNLRYAWDFCIKLFGGGFVWPHNTWKFAYYLDVPQVIAFIAAVLCAMPIFSKILDTNKQNKLNIWLIVVFLFAAASVMSGTFNPFIYFRF